MEDVHLKTDTLYRVCRAVHRSFDEAVHNTVRESKGIQTETVALFIRKRIYMWLEQLIYPQPYIECRPNIVVKNVPKTVDVLDVVIQKLKRVKMVIVFHVGVKCFMKKCPTNPIIVQGVMKNLL